MLKYENIMGKTSKIGSVALLGAPEVPPSSNTTALRY